MKYVSCLGLAVCSGMILLSTGWAATPTEDLDEALRLELKGDAQLAFAHYLRAANAGLSQAQFNVAAMLDSGRGVRRNVSEAALWYARAAALGDRRAAYNLGQLYEAGEGVPQNPQLAHAWFAAAGLAASTLHHADAQRNTSSSTDTVAVTAPTPIAPPSDSKVYLGSGGVTLVWSAKTQPTEVTYYIELRSIQNSGSNEVFAHEVNVSSIFVGLPDKEIDYAWRVATLSKSARSYSQSQWMRFRAAATNKSPQ